MTAPAPPDRTAEPLPPRARRAAPAAPPPQGGRGSAATPSALPPGAGVAAPDGAAAGPCGLKPYYQDDQVQLFLGDCRKVLPALGVTADCIVADPPYSCTSLGWDRWPDGWLEVAAQASNSMWCFLPRREFVEPPFRGREFHAAGWRFSQPAIWEKHAGSGFAADRLKQVHEEFGHWYRGRWSEVTHEAPRVEVDYRTKGNSGRQRPRHTGDIALATWSDDGTRIVRSVIRARSMWRRGAIHPTEKPVDLLTPLITYACPPGGLVIDPFAGSGSTLDATRRSGRRAIGVELHEPYAERAARRLSQMTLEAP
jgi:site-specific DNA-methyltransferase (adenine-specific)